MHDRLFIPGPVEVRPELLQAIAQPQVGHRTQAYMDVHSATIPLLKKILYTEQDVLLFTCSATGVMEGSLRNLCQKKALLTVNGAFSKRQRLTNLFCKFSIDRRDESLSLRILRRQPKALHLRLFNCDEIPETYFRSAAGPH